MSETFNWGSNYDAAADALKPLDAAKYRVRVKDSTARRASTGSPMINLVLEVLDGPRAGKTLNTNVVMTLDADKPMGRAMFFQHLGAFGLDRNFFAQLPSDIDQAMVLIAQTLAGRTVIADVGIRTEGAYKGRNEVNRYDADTGVPIGGVGLPGVTLPGSMAMNLPTTPAAAPAAPPTPVINIPATPAPVATSPAMGVPPVATSTPPAAAAPGAPPDLPI